MEPELKMLSPAWIGAYASACTLDWQSTLARLKQKATFSPDDFEHYVLASSLYSSKIEGNTLDVNSFFRNRTNQDFPGRKEVREIENLASAYRFASGSTLSLDHFLESHRILSETLLSKDSRGKIRTEQVGIRDSASLRPVYLAVEPHLAGEELQKLFADISTLLKSNLPEHEVFYYASMIHLWTAMIHPFMDGNGRAARLMEKWFLASVLGASAWSIPSEKYYWDHRPDYYRNIALGFNYYALHWERCLPFLLMLPEAVTGPEPG